MQLAIEQYIVHLAGVRRLSPHTCANYQRDLNRALAFCEQAAITCWQDFSSEAIRKWLMSERERGLGARSLRRALSALRGLMAYLQQEQQLEDNPALAVQAPRAASTLPAVCDVDQLASSLDHRVDDAEPLLVRDLAMFELLYSSGLRVSELVGLNKSDLDFSERLVRVHGKGNKTRVVPVGKKSISVLERWLSLRADWPGAALPAVFLSCRQQRITVRSVQHRLSLWTQRFSPQLKLHPHKLRHCFASHLLESSGDLRAIQELLGHAAINTTQIYSHLDFQHLAMSYDKAHPRAKKKE